MDQGILLQFSPEHASQHWSISMVLLLPTTITSLAVVGIKWMIILIFYINLSKAKAYSLLAFCTAIVGNIIFDEVLSRVFIRQISQKKTFKSTPYLNARRKNNTNLTLKSTTHLSRLPLFNNSAAGEHFYTLI